MEPIPVQMGELFKALGDPLRLGILRLLPDSDCCCAVYNVSELADELGVSQPTVSHHLKLLKHAGVVRCRRMCRDVYYWIDREVLDTALADFAGSIVEPHESKDQESENTHDGTA